jgi:hypothetical protein
LELETATQALWEINKKIVDLMTTAGDSTRNLGVQMDILTKRLEKLSPSSKDYLKTLLEIKEVQDKLNNLEQRHEYILSGTQKRIDNITSGIKAGKYDAHGGLQGPKKDKFGRIISGEVEGYKFTESDKAMEKAAIADAVQQGAWIEEYINKLDQLKLTAKTVADDILGFMQDMSGGITDALFGETVNWGSIFKNFLKSLVQQGIMTLFSSLFGGGLMNLAGSNSLFGGLVAPKQHSGGLMGDERVVVVQAGERILNRREAKDYQKGRNGGSVTIQNVNVYQAKYRSKLEARAAVADIIDDMLEKGKF